MRTARDDLEAALRSHGDEPCDDVAVRILRKRDAELLRIVLAAVTRPGHGDAQDIAARMLRSAEGGAVQRDLTRRQVQVIAGFARGHTHEQIGTRLGVTWTTVRTHQRRIARDTGCRGPAAIVAYAYRNGYLDGLTPESRPRIELTLLQGQLLEQMTSSLTLAQIREELDISIHTLKSRVTGVHRKLRAVNRAHAVAIAWQQGLLLAGIHHDHWTDPNDLYEKGKT